MKAKRPEFTQANVKPGNEIDYEDVKDAALKVLKTTNIAAGAAQIPGGSQIEDETFDLAATAAEEMVITLLRFYRNEKMLVLALDEIAAAMREGY